MTTKPCSKCRRILPFAMFNKAKWIKSTGLRPDCKDCYSAARKKIHAAKPPGPNTVRTRELRALAANGLRKCLKCGAALAICDENFSGHDTTCRPCVRAKVADWQAANAERAKTTAYQNCANRYAAKRHRTPKWLTKEQRAEMRSVYAECRALNASGDKHHVDHIVPLVGRNVCGLHVPWNLQILSATENVRKSNKWASP